MYGGFDKFGGDVVGAEEPEGNELQETLENSSMEEVLVVQADIGNGIEETVLLSARLNVGEGGLLWVPEQNAQTSYKYVDRFTRG